MSMRVYYFRYYWPSNLVFIVWCVTYIPNLRKIEKTAVVIVDDRYFWHTDRHTLKWFYICPMPCIALDRQWSNFLCEARCTNGLIIFNKKNDHSEPTYTCNNKKFGKITTYCRKMCAKITQKSEPNNTVLISSSTNPLMGQYRPINRKKSQQFSPAIYQ